MVKGMTKVIPDEFDLFGNTTRQHIMAGDPSNPALCTEKLAVADAWNKMFGHSPNIVRVDRERIQVKDQSAWYWGPPTDQMIKNLTALDNGMRRELNPHSWKVSMIKKADVIPMSKETKEKLKGYAKIVKLHEPTTRRRINGLTRMVSIKKTA